MKRLTFLSYIILLLVLTHTAFAQDENEVTKDADQKISKNRTSLKTEVLPEILSTAINNGIISRNGSTIKLNTTIFGLKKLFDSTVKIDTNYARKRFSRNVSFGSGVDIDETSKINGVQSFLKIALVNKRDYTDETHLNAKAKNIRASIFTEVDALGEFVHQNIGLPLEKAARTGLISIDTAGKLASILTTYANSKSKSDFEKIKTAFSTHLKTIGADPLVFDKFAQREKRIDSLETNLASAINAGSLLTFSYNGDYVNKAWDSIILKLEYVKGLGGIKDSTKPWDFYAAASYSFKRDTLLKQSLQKQIISCKLGINKVFAKRNDGGPLFEALGAGEFKHIFQGSLYPSEKKNSLFVDFTFTIKVSQAISIPLEIKSDVTNKGNLFGYLNFKWDILTSRPK